MFFWRGLVFFRFCLDWFLWRVYYWGGLWGFNFFKWVSCLVGFFLERGEWVLCFRVVGFVGERSVLGFLFGFFKFLVILGRRKEEMWGVVGVGVLGLFIDGGVLKYLFSWW